MKGSFAQFCRIVTVGSALAGLIQQSVAGEPSARRSAQRVMTIPERQQMIQVLEHHLRRSDGPFYDELRGQSSPFEWSESSARTKPAFVGAVPELDQLTEGPGNASLLDVVAAHLSSRITGTLARGSQHYIQLNNGQMLAPNSSFAVRLPEFEDQRVTVVIQQIDSGGYRLRMGDAVRDVPLQLSKVNEGARLTRDSTSSSR